MSRMALLRERVMLLERGGSLDASTEDAVSNCDSCGESIVGSVNGCSSVVNSIGSSRTGSMAFSDSKQSKGAFDGTRSYLAAFPRYRNSGAFVHGTRFRNFTSIMELGLKTANSDIFMIDEVRPDGRVPGLHNPPEILIFIDENKARSEFMEFEYDAAQGTWRTKGINGVIRPWFFQKVVDQRPGLGKGNVLFQSKEDPMMLANQMKGSQVPPYLIHATYWSSVHAIMREGILPAKRPTSSLREPFKELLQGAENHIYTVSSHLFTSTKYQSHMFLRSPPEPEMVPEVEELDYKVPAELVGLEKAPDALFIIDARKAIDLGLQLNLVQSADREETIFVEGAIPRELLSKVEPNDPVDLPDALKAKVVDVGSFEDFPVIDLSNTDEAALLEQLRYACEVAGFMQIVGHGVCEDLQQQQLDMTRRFFQLSEAVKADLGLNASSPLRGYLGKGVEDLDEVFGAKVDEAARGRAIPKARKDNKEALDTNGVAWSRPEGGFVARSLGMPSRIPAEELLPGFEEVLDAYAREMFRVCRRLLELMAAVLELPADFFEQHLTAPVATHRLCHHWPMQDLSQEVSMGGHTDYGLLTILKQDIVGGLQVFNARDSRWVHCVPIENAFVVNLGDMMDRWTGGRFKATVHRVVNVSPTDSYCVPYFLEPNMDTLIVHGGLCQPESLPNNDSKALHRRRCQLRQHWMQQRSTRGAATSEEIVERFYRASGQLKDLAETPISPAGSLKAKCRQPRRKNR